MTVTSNHRGETERNRAVVMSNANQLRHQDQSRNASLMKKDEKEEVKAPVKKNDIRDIRTLR